MKRWLFTVALVLVAALQPLRASTFVAMSVRDLVRDSEAVVEGEVLKVESYWSASGRIIVTEAMVRVQDLVSGEAPSVVRVKTFGGTVDGYTVVASGFPSFVKGERLLLFLEADDEAGMMRVAGYQQGQYRVERDDHGVEKAVSVLEEGANLVTPSNRTVFHPRVLPLIDLKNLVRTEAARLSGSPVEN